MTGVTSLSLSAITKKVQIKETILMLSFAVLFPFLVHLLPSVGNVPMGAILLPAFIAPFIANYFFKMHVGLFTAIVGPTLNFILTGSPKLEYLALYTTELVVFTLLSLLFLKQGKLKMFSAPVAFILAKVFSTGLALFPFLAGYVGVNSFLSMIYALPGILLLFVLNVSLLKMNKN